MINELPIGAVLAAESTSGGKKFETCDTCKWWSQPQIFSDGGGHLYRKVLGTCFNQRLLEQFRPVEVASVIVAPPDSAATDELLTGPKFGCVHHESRFMKRNAELI